MRPALCFFFFFFGRPTSNRFTQPRRDLAPVSRPPTSVKGLIGVDLLKDGGETRVFGDQHCKTTKKTPEPFSGDVQCGLPIDKISQCFDVKRLNLLSSGHIDAMVYLVEYLK